MDFTSTPGRLRALGTADMQQPFTRVGGLPFPDLFTEEIDLFAQPTGGIDFSSANANADEAALLVFQPPNDRSWFLLKINMTGKNIAVGAAARIQGLYVDGQSIMPIWTQTGFRGVTTTGGTMTIYGRVGSSAQASDIETQFMLPINKQLSMILELLTTGNAGCEVDLSIWVWEIRKQTPPSQPVTTVVMPKENELWQ